MILTAVLRTSIEALRQQTGQQLGPDIADAVQRMPQAALDALAEALLAEPPTPRKQVPDDELWPLVNGRASLLSRGAQAYVDAPGPAGLNVMAAMNPRDVGRATFSNSAVRALLYGHGLVLEDPLLMAAELHLGGPAETRSLSRAFVEAATISICEIDALLDAGIIQTFFVSSHVRKSDSALEAEMLDALASSSVDRDELWDAFEAGYVDGLSPSLRELWRKVRAGDREPPLHLIDDALTETDAAVVRTFVDVVASLRPNAVVDNTVAIVASAVDDLRRLGGRHDLLCASPLFARLLFLGAADPVAKLRVQQLARTPVPSIGQLDLSDLVSIRQSSEGFAAWRSQLSLGLDHAHRLREELGPEVDVAAAVSEVLADARQQLLTETRRSRVLSRGGLVSFVAGALGGAISGAAEGVTAVTLAGAGGLAGAIVQRVLGRVDQPSGALRRHFLVFERRTDATS